MEPFSAVRLTDGKRRLQDPGAKRMQLADHCQEILLGACAKKAKCEVLIQCKCFSQ